MKKSALSAAIVTSLGLVVSSPGHADTVNILGLTIKDVGSNTANGAGNYSSVLDGRSGAFQLNSTYLNVNTYAGAKLFTGDVGTGTMLGGGLPNPTGSFSTGFIFSSAPFVPFTYGSGFSGTIDTISNALSITSLDFGGNYAGALNFLLPPDTNFPIEVLWANRISLTDWNVAFRWGHDITTADDPTLQFTNFTTQWVLEGVLTTDAVPIPGAVWLFGSGLLGMAGVARRKKA